MGCAAVLDSHWDKGNMLDARGFMDCTWSGNAECSLSFVTRANQQILTAKYSVLSNRLLLQRALHRGANAALKICGEGQGSTQCRAISPPPWLAVPPAVRCSLSPLLPPSVCFLPCTELSSLWVSMVVSGLKKSCRNAATPCLEREGNFSTEAKTSPLSPRSSLQCQCQITPD